MHLAHLMMLFSKYYWEWEQVALAKIVSTGDRDNVPARDDGDGGRPKYTAMATTSRRTEAGWLMHTG